MPEVLSVETEDDLDERAYRAPSGGGGPLGGFGNNSSPWKLIVVLAALTTFAALVGFVVFVRGGSSSPSSSSSTQPNGTSSTLSANDPRVAASQKALTAWGKFAVTGNLDLVKGTFDPSGPQYAELQKEVPALQANPAGDPPYQYTLVAPTSIDTSDKTKATIRGVVHITRPGESEQKLAWDITLSANPSGGWWLSTVASAPADYANQALTAKEDLCTVAKEASQLPSDTAIGTKMNAEADFAAQLGVARQFYGTANDVWKRMVQSAPSNLRNQVATVAAGQQYTVDQLNTVNTQDDYNTMVKNFSNSKVTKDANKALALVSQYTKKQCGVSVDVNS